MDEGVGTYPKELDWAKQVVPRLRRFAADKRIEQLPAKFQWTMQAAADEIERLHTVIGSYAQYAAAAERDIRRLNERTFYH